jgi:hypothetical protein
MRKYFSRIVNFTVKDWLNIETIRKNIKAIIGYLASGIADIVDSSNIQVPQIIKSQPRKDVHPHQCSIGILQLVCTAVAYVTQRILDGLDLDLSTAKAENY